MQTRLEEVCLIEGRDEVKWMLERFGKYTTKSLYKELTFGGIRDEQMMDVWGCRVPLKIQIFMWMVFHDKIQPAVQLKKRNWSGEVNCKICNTPETTDHILFQCPVANFVWTFLRNVLGWDTTPVVLFLTAC